MDKTTGNFNITSELLGLSDIKILEITIAADGAIHIQLESTKTEVHCQHCNELTEPNGSNRRRRLQHLSLLGRSVYIDIETLRGICKRCNKHPTTTQVLPWYKLYGQYTKPYEDYLLLQLINSTLTDVAKKELQSEDAIQGLVDKRITERNDLSEIKRIGLLGVDEITMLKGHDDYVTIITSRYNGETRILAVLKGKKQSTIEAYLATIPAKKQKTIMAVCLDMCDGYIGAVKAKLSKDIPIIVDRFHVIQLLHKRLDKLRSSELKRIKKQLSERRL